HRVAGMMTALAARKAVRTQDISSMPADSEPCMWGSATLVTLVSRTCMTVTIITESVIAHLRAVEISVSIRGSVASTVRPRIFPSRLDVNPSTPSYSLTLQVWARNLEGARCELCSRCGDRVSRFFQIHAAVARPCSECRPLARWVRFMLKPVLMRVLLVHPSALMYSELYLRLEPIGLERVAAVVRPAGHEVRVLDLQIFSRPDYRAELDAFRPQAVGFSVNYLANVPEVIDLAKEARSVLPECFVMIGGHSGSFIADELLEHGRGAIDCVVRGEGEI